MSQIRYVRVLEIFINVPPINGEDKAGCGSAKGAGGVRRSKMPLSMVKATRLILAIYRRLR